MNIDPRDRLDVRECALGGTRPISIHCNVWLTLRSIIRAATFPSKVTKAVLIVGVKWIVKCTCGDFYNGVTLLQRSMSDVTSWENIELVQSYKSTLGDNYNTLNTISYTT